MEQILERVIKIEEKLELMSKRLEEVENVHVAHGLQAEDKLKDVVRECESKITTSELSCEGKIEILGTKLQDVSDKTSAIELKLKDMSTEWPTPEEAKFVKVEKNKVRQISFADKFKGKDKETIVLIGDSLARGVGQKLEQQLSHMVTTKSRGGARIEHVTEQIGLLKDNDDRHLVVMVGTNNVQKENSEEIRGKYKSLLEACKKAKNRKVSVIGIPRRLDLSGYQNSRRIGANRELEKMCSEHDVGFVSFEPYNSRIARDGVHLNHIGQDELAKKIFEHCKSFLV